MTDTIVPFRGRPKPDKKLSGIESYILAMRDATPEQIRRDIHVRQANILESWTRETISHLGPEVATEMIESMLLHLKAEAL